MLKNLFPGVYDWVVSFDLNSLYPHLIMQYNISPETLLDERHPTATVDRLLNKEITFEMYKDNAVCANGAMYRKDIKGFLPELMEKMYSERVIFKKRMLKAKQEYEKHPSIELEKEIARCNNIQMAKKISLILLMVPLAINIFVTINLLMQKQSPSQVKSQSVGLRTE